MKKITIGYAAAFALLCVLPFGLRMFGLGTGGSAEFEKRKMAEKPAFSFSGISEYPGKMEAYYDDTLPFRTPMIQTNSRINYALLSGSSSMQLIQGRDGWLFYNPGGSDGDPVSDYYFTDPFTEEELEQTKDKLLKARDDLAKRDCEFLIYICPNKETLYGSEFFPSYYPRNDGRTKAGQIAEYLSENTDLNLIYAEEMLRQAEESETRFPWLYYRQDTHWNGAGGYLGARQLLGGLGIELPAVAELEITETISPYRDLAELSTLSNFLEPETDYVLSGYTDREVTREEDPERGIIRTRCPGADPRKVLMIRDSFCIAMMDIIASQFEECVFVTHDKYRVSSIEEEMPDIVVYESVERYVSSLGSFRAE